MRVLILLLAAAVLPVAANAGELQIYQHTNLGSNNQIESTNYWLPAGSWTTPVDGKIEQTETNKSLTVKPSLDLRKIFGLKAQR